jgi:aspartate--ammonia ligase
MPNHIFPRAYQPVLSLRETERAIRLIKEFFQTNLAVALNLTRVTAPLFVHSGTGINDDLNGVERPVAFPVRDLRGARVEIVHSLAKWKRLMLADYGFGHGEGLYTDMNAIRPDEGLDNTHSLYVDQWDWERVMLPRERTLQFLTRIVTRIYGVIQRTEEYICHCCAGLTPVLPETITVLHSEELEQRYPRLTPREREYRVCKQHGAVFVVGIGGDLRQGGPHDGRAPDYDDWSTPNQAGYRGFNGDILVYYPLLDCALELSSMGIRVDARALRRQLALRGAREREKLYFHRRLLRGELPLSIGGGIGQSRLCMFYLRKAHIGEIQASVWPETVVRTCRAHGITLL